MPRTYYFGFRTVLPVNHPFSWCLQSTRYCVQCKFIVLTANKSKIRIVAKGYKRRSSRCAQYGIITVCLGSHGFYVNAWSFAFQIQHSVPVRHLHHTAGRDGRVLHDHGPRTLGKQNHRTDDAETRGVDQVEEKGERAVTKIVYRFISCLSQLNYNIFSCFSRPIETRENTKIITCRDL